MSGRNSNLRRLQGVLLVAGLALVGAVIAALTTTVFFVTSALHALFRLV